MSKAEKKPQIDDVLSSIKRLVSDEVSSSHKAKSRAAAAFGAAQEAREIDPSFEEFDAEQKSDALILTPALRVVEDHETAPDQQNQRAGTHEPLNARDGSGRDHPSGDDVPDTDVDSILEAISRDAFPELLQEKAEEASGLQDLPADDDDEEPALSGDGDDQNAALADGYFNDGDAEEPRFEQPLAAEAAQQETLILQAADAVDAEDLMPSASEEGVEEGALQQGEFDDGARPETDGGDSVDGDGHGDEIEMGADHDEPPHHTMQAEFYENEHIQGESQVEDDAVVGLNINLDAILGRKAGPKDPETPNLDKADIKAMTQDAIGAVLAETVETTIAAEAAEENLQEWQDADDADAAPEPATIANDVQTDDADSIEEMMTAEITDFDDDFDEDNEDFLDESMLRDLVAQFVRAELQGSLGERITRNVRKLVRREIHRVLESKEFE